MEAFSINTDVVGLAPANTCPVPASAVTAEASVLEDLPVPPASPDWYEMDPHLRELLGAVPAQSFELERTTILTWMYLQRGAISFEQLVLRIPGPSHKTLKKKYARRALRGLIRIGAIKLMEQAVDTALDTTADLNQDALDGEATIGRGSIAHITSAGMTWMRRAWQARYIGADNRPGQLHWIHREYLLEEEEGKGNEPYWIERFGGGEAKQPASARSFTSVLLGGAAVASVFDLHPATAARKGIPQTASSPRSRRK